MTYCCSFLFHIRVTRPRCSTLIFHFINVTICTRVFNAGLKNVHYLERVSIIFSGNGSVKHFLWLADYLQDYSRRPEVIICGNILFNTLGPRQSYRHIPDDIFKCISLTENVSISLKILLQFVPKVRMMAWCRPGDKLLSETKMLSLLTNICVIRPRWVKVV